MLIPPVTVREVLAYLKQLQLVSKHVPFFDAVVVPESLKTDKFAWVTNVTIRNNYVALNQGILLQEEQAINGYEFFNILKKAPPHYLILLSLDDSDLFICKSYHQELHGRKSLLYLGGSRGFLQKYGFE